LKLRSPLLGNNKPTWSLYDIQNNNEYQLAESFASEFCDISGIEMTYFIRDATIAADPLYGESATAGYEGGKKSKLLYEVGEIPTLYSTFGMVATDSIVCHIPQSVWYRDISKTVQPKPGDAVYLPFFVNDYSGNVSGRSFEVTHAAHDQSLFMLRSLVHVIYLIPYRFSEESQSARDVSSDLSTEFPSVSAWGDNAWLENNKYNDPNIDESIYGG
jgi:hypothetical protein